MKEIGVNLNNFYLSDANADYVKIKWGSKDLLSQKDYTLKVDGATTVGNVFIQLDKVKIMMLLFGRLIILKWIA